MVREDFEDIMNIIKTLLLGGATDATGNSSPKNPLAVFGEPRQCDVKFR
jgi:hypothetical protein